MNRRMVFRMVGLIVCLEAALLLLPLTVSLIYRESCWLAFLITVGAAALVGGLMILLSNPGSRLIYAKEGFAIVSLAWLSLSALGALPFVISGEIPNYIDAFFETVSGLTTTGASILTEVESMSRGILFWRSFTHWIGGMGILVLIMAIVPNLSDRSIHIMRAEMPGPIIGKLVPRIKDTAKILYLIYIGLTVLEAVFLLFGGMPLFDSVCTALGTAGTGGFGIKNNSIGGYSPYIQWVVTVFMLLFGVNFNLYYLMLLRRFRPVFKSGELRAYFILFFAAAAVIAADISSMYESFADASRAAAFQTASIMTTTGFSSTDFNAWPSLSKGILLILMFIGGCAGSTAGGLKLSRLIILLKRIRSEFMHLLHPRSVSVVRFGGKPVDEATSNGVVVYFALYMVCVLVVFGALSLEPGTSFSFETNFTAAVACFNNVGPGFGGVGPTACYAAYSVLSKILLSFAMLLGRLEIFPLLLAFSPSTWSKR